MRASVNCVRIRRIRYNNEKTNKSLGSAYKVTYKGWDEQTFPRLDQVFVHEYCLFKAFLMMGKERKEIYSCRLF